MADNDLPTDGDIVDLSQEKDITVRIDTLFKEARRYRNVFKHEWEESERFYDGRHWERTNRKPVKNFVFTIIEGEVPILTDSRPSTDIVPNEQEEQEDAKVLEAALHEVYEENHLDLKVSQAVRASLTTGTGWQYVH